MKAIILARVSTKEQEEGHSIAAQRQQEVVTGNTFP
jgi:DNA invertase Pin-like site-specific DNA recombinase